MVNTTETRVATSDDWYTPPEIIEEILAALGQRRFTLDVASPHPPRVPCDRHYTIDDDALRLAWKGWYIWCNPPYSNTAAWVRKAEQEVMEGRAALVVGLLPANVDAGWYHDHVHRWMHWVRRHRIHFETPSGRTSSNTKGSLLVAWTLDRAVAETMRAGMRRPGTRWRFVKDADSWREGNTVVHRVTDDLLLAEQAILDALDEIKGDAEAETWVVAVSETAD